MLLWALESSEKLMGQEEEFPLFPGGEWDITLQIKCPPPPQKRLFLRVSLQKGSLGMQSRVDVMQLQIGICWM